MEDETNHWLRYLQIERGFSSGTVQGYRNDILKGLAPFLRPRGISRPGAITKDDVRDYLHFLTEERGNSAVTRARKLAAIKSFLNFLVDNGQLAINPASSIKSPKIPQTQPSYLTDDDCLRLLDVVGCKAGPRAVARDLAMVIMFVHLGLRVSELVGLKLEDVNLERCQIKVIRKGNKEQYLHLNSEAVKALRQYLASRANAKNGNCFVGVNGGFLRRTHVYAVVRKYLRLAGIKTGKCGPHLLRHTFCTRLHQKGVDPFTIKELAGHKSLNTTMRYVTIENREHAEAIDRLEFGLQTARNSKKRPLK